MKAALVGFAVLGALAFGLTAHGQQKGLVSSREEVGEREDGSGAFRTHCVESHISKDDPLVWPGKPGATHEHVFFGNKSVDAYTTQQRLRNGRATTCDGVALNQSAYWVPALYDAHGERIRYIDPLFYYKTGYHVPAKKIVAPPAGLRMIAGNAKARSPQGLHIAKFRCESWRAGGRWFSPGDPLDHINRLPRCKNGDLLEIRIVFPQCWDGKNLTSADHQSHMAYPREAKMPRVGTGSCPRSHPVAIPEISYNFAIYVSEEMGPSDQWRFSSDMGTKTVGGSSVHADWMNGWDETIMQRIVKNCLNKAQECMVGLLGDGTRLKPIPLD